MRLNRSPVEAEKIFYVCNSVLSQENANSSMPLTMEKSVGRNALIVSIFLFKIKVPFPPQILSVTPR